MSHLFKVTELIGIGVQIQIQPVVHNVYQLFESASGYQVLGSVRSIVP